MKMNITIFVKDELDVNGPFQLTNETTIINTDTLVSIFDPASLAALSLAKEILDFSKHTVTALTVGPKSSERILRTSLAIGATKAIRIWDDAFDREKPSAVVTAKLLAEAAKYSDLILCGYKSLSGDAGFVGPSVAATLNIPQICGVSWFDISEDHAKITAHRKLKYGDREVNTVTTPAVLTVDDDAAETPYPSLPAVIDAECADIEVLNLEQLGFSNKDAKDKVSGQFEKYTPPKPRAKQTAGAGSPDMSGADLMSMLAGASSGKSDSSLLEGDPEKIAKEVVSFLKEKELIV
ncbi:hypothetical protein FACS1894104_2520 [Actinomycetota bacterium]|nr:hypothetical protein FACS1894104_2520 [Actinomycetota bacterium]